MKWKSLSCLTLCDPLDYTVHGILQARILEWVAFPFSRGSSQPQDRTQVSRIAGGFFTSWTTREAQEVAQFCLTLCNPMNCSLPGSSVHGILQARILEWVPLSVSTVSSQPKDRTQVSCIAGRFFTFWATREAFFLYLWCCSVTLNATEAQSRCVIKERPGYILLCVTGFFFENYIFLHLCGYRWKDTHIKDRVSLRSEILEDFFFFLCKSVFCLRLCALLVSL